MITAAGAAEADRAGPEKSPPQQALRVCADPANLPLSNRAGEGYENKLAQALAADLGRRIEYTFFPQRMGFVRSTLKARDPGTGRWKCDVIMGVPKGYELTATTRPYLHSTYAMVFHPSTQFASLRRPDDLLRFPPEFRAKLRFGVFAKSPGVDWLLRNNLIDRAVFYANQSGDPEDSPAAVLERGFAEQAIDIGIAWGPVAGLLVSRHPDDMTSVSFPKDPDIRFDYEISMGVRFGEKEWLDTLDRWVGEHPAQIGAILAAYRIPIVD
jgi:quinoprotein dehydrogenase-associated probable ABC transporter substrate-binding protein